MAQTSTGALSIPDIDRYASCQNGRCNVGADVEREIVAALRYRSNAEASSN